MRLFRPFTLVFAASAGIASACSFLGGWSMRYDTVSTNAVRVIQRQPQTNLMTQEVTYREDTSAVTTLSGFKSWFENAVLDSGLVFIGRLDSILEFYAPGDTTQTHLTPVVVLRDTGILAGRWPYYARVRVDTVFKGSLPAKTFWIRGSTQGTSCDQDLTYSLHKPFLNVSNGLNRNADLKIPKFLWPHYDIIPKAHWFDGRYLVSPAFPGHRLDITSVYPEYPATSLVTPRSLPKPFRVDGKAYRPDGRVAPSEISPSNAPVPLLKR